MQLLPPSENLSSRKTSAATTPIKATNNVKAFICTNEMKKCAGVLKNFSTRVTGTDERWKLHEPRNSRCVKRVEPIFMLLERGPDTRWFAIGRSGDANQSHRANKNGCSNLFNVAKYHPCGGCRNFHARTHFVTLHKRLRICSKILKKLEKNMSMTTPVLQRRFIR